MRKSESRRIHSLLAAATSTLFIVGSVFAQSANPGDGRGATGAGATDPSTSTLQPAASGGVGSNSSTSSGTTNGSTLNGRASATDEPPTPGPADVQALLSSIVTSVIAPDGKSKLTDQLASADANRLDGAGAASTLADTVSQLQKAFQAKYNRPLNIDQDQATVFPEASFRVGVAMAVVRDEPEASASTAPSAVGGSETGARQASAVSTPSAVSSRDASSSSANSGPGNGAASSAGSIAGSSSSASITGSSSNSASSSDLPAIPKLAKRISINMPEENGLPETGLKLANQHGQWKVDVPAALTTASLEKNLQTHLESAMNMQWPDDATVAEQMVARHILLAFASEGSTGQVGGVARAPMARRGPAAPVADAGAAAPAAGVAEPTSKPTRQTYKEKMEAERAERDAKRAAAQQEREQRRQQAQHRNGTTTGNDPNGGSDSGTNTTSKTGTQSR